MELPLLVEQFVDKKAGMTMNWAINDGGSPNHEGAAFGSGMENHHVVAELERMEHGDGPNQRTKNPRDLDLLVLEMPLEDKKLILEIRRDRRSWIGSMATPNRSDVQNLLRERWSCGLDLRHRVADRAIHIFQELCKEADICAGKCVKVVKKNGWILRASCGLKSPACVVSGAVAAKMARAVQ